MRNLIKKSIAGLLITAMLIGLIPIQVLAAAPASGGIIINGGRPVIAHPGEVLRVIVEQLPVSQGNQTMMVANSDASARFYYNFHTLVGYGSVIFARPVQTQGRPDSETVTFTVDEQGTAVFYIYINRNTDYGSTFSLYFDFTTWIPTTVYVMERGTEPVDGPSIVVLTEFPAGEVNVPWIDIEYIAIPTPGATIIEVFYTINDGASSTVFYHRASPDAPRGQLGTARVFARPYAENRFVFTMLDSAGGEASFEVANRPGFATMGGALFTPPVPPEARHYTFIPCPERVALQAQFDERYGHLLEFDPLRIPRNVPRWVATDRITVIVNEGVTPAQMQEFARSIGGMIIGHLPNCTSYVIGFPIRPVEEILELVEQLRDGYSPLIYHAYATRRTGLEALFFDSGLPETDWSLNYESAYIYPFAEDGSGLNTPATGGQVLSPFQSGANPTNDPFWGSTYPNPNSNYYGYLRDWGFNAINVPAAWNFINASQTQRTRKIRVGIIDSWFNPNHLDLNLNPDNFRNTGWPDNHGNMVTSIIAAYHDNDRNLAGVVNNSRDSFFGHGTRTLGCIPDALHWLVVHGAQVINVSMGPVYIDDLQRRTESDMAFLKQVREYLQDGVGVYEFTDETLRILAMLLGVQFDNMVVQTPQTLILWITGELDVLYERLTVGIPALRINQPIWLARTNARMEELLDAQFDFIVVQSAGNIPP